MRFVKWLAAAAIVLSVGVGATPVRAQTDGGGPGPDPGAGPGADPVVVERVPVVSGLDAVNCRSSATQVSTDGGATFSDAFVVGPFRSWVAPVGQSRWLSHEPDPAGPQDGTPGACPIPVLTGDARLIMTEPNVFVFRHQFDVDRTLGEPGLALQIAYDNELPSMTLNDTPIALVDPPPPGCTVARTITDMPPPERPLLPGEFRGVDCDQTSFKQFTQVDGAQLTSALVDGTNTLEFTIHDYNGRQGVVFDGSLSYTEISTLEPGINIVKTSSTDAVTEVGQVVEYSYVVRNTGNTSLTNVTVVDDNVDAAVTCPKTELAVDEEMTCTATRTVTEADFTAAGPGTIPEGISCSLSVLSVDGAEAVYRYDAADGLPRSFWVDGQEYPMLSGTTTVAPVPSDGQVGYPSRLHKVEFEKLRMCTARTLENTATVTATGVGLGVEATDSWSLPFGT